MRTLLGILLFLTVGCGSSTPAWHARIPEPVEPAQAVDTTFSDYADSFAGQKHFGRERAFGILLNTTHFSTTGVGPTGSDVGPQVYAFKAIAKDGDASPAFLDLLKRGRPAGKAYALCGLYLVDRRAFDREVPAFRVSPATLNVSSGCEVRTVTLGEVVENRSPVAVRLAKGQSLDEWFDAHPDGGVLDIVGGSYPAALAEAR